MAAKGVTGPGGGQEIPFTIEEKEIKGDLKGRNIRIIDTGKEKIVKVDGPIKSFFYNLLGKLGGRSRALTTDEMKKLLTSIVSKEDIPPQSENVQNILMLKLDKEKENESYLLGIKLQLLEKAEKKQIPAAVVSEKAIEPSSAPEKVLQFMGFHRDMMMTAEEAAEEIKALYPDKMPNLLDIDTMGKFLAKTHLEIHEALLKLYSKT